MSSGSSFSQNMVACSTRGCLLNSFEAALKDMRITSQQLHDQPCLGDSFQLSKVCVTTARVSQIFGVTSRFENRRLFAVELIPDS